MKKKNCSLLFLGEIINIMWLKSTRKDIFALLDFINNKIQKRGLGGRGEGGEGGVGYHIRVYNILEQIWSWLR